MKYEEFVERMRNVITEEDRKQLWDDMNEPMGVKEIETHLKSNWETTAHPVFDRLKENGNNGWSTLCRTIQPLTRRQGFVPDWSKAPEWANCVSLYWARMHGSDRSFEGEAVMFDAIPRPAPKMREMSAFEKVFAYTVWKSKKRAEAGYEDSPYYSSNLLAIELAEGKTIDELCKAAGISTQVPY